MGKVGKKKQRQGPGPHVIGALAERCAALGCPPRLAIVAHLAVNGPTSVNDLGEVAGISVSGVSQHLVKLRAAGAVVGRREAQTIRYELVPGWVEGLIEELEGIAERTAHVAAKSARTPPKVLPPHVAAKEVKGEIKNARPMTPNTFESEVEVQKVGTAGKKRKATSARPDASRSDDQGSGNGEVAIEAADAQEGRPDVELVDLDDIVGIDSSVMEADAENSEHDEDGGSGTRFIDAPEADEVYPEEAAGTVVGDDLTDTGPRGTAYDEVYPEEAAGIGSDPDRVPAYSPGPSYGGAR